MMIYGRFLVSAKRTSLGHLATGEKHCPKTTHEPQISNHYSVHKAAKDTRCIGKSSQTMLPCKHIKCRNLPLKQERATQHIAASDPGTATSPSKHTRSCHRTDSLPGVHPRSPWTLHQDRVCSTHSLCTDFSAIHNIVCSFDCIATRSTPRMSYDMSEFNVQNGPSKRHGCDSGFAVS